MAVGRDTPSLWFCHWLGGWTCSMVVFYRSAWWSQTDVCLFQDGRHRVCPTHVDSNYSNHHLPSPPPPGAVTSNIWTSLPLPQRLLWCLALLSPTPVVTRPWVQGQPCLPPATPLTNPRITLILFCPTQVRLYGFLSSYHIYSKWHPPELPKLIPIPVRKSFQ